MVAVKLLKPQWAPREKVVERLRDEARMLAMLRHRCIVRAEDLVRVQGRLGVGAVVDALHHKVPVALGRTKLATH